MSATPPGTARRVVINMRDDRPGWAMPDFAADAIQSAFPTDWEVIDVRAPVSARGDGDGMSAEALAAVTGAEVYFGFGFPRALFEAATTPKSLLRWVHTGSAGVASALYPEFVASDVTFTNSAGIHAPPMAETALAMILHFARGLDFAIRSQQRREWGKAPFEDHHDLVHEIGHSTLGIYGLGGVGRELAWRASALGMKVIATKRNDRVAPPGVEIIRGADALTELLKRSDYVVVAAPSTKETRNSIDAAMIAHMKPGAVIINVSRGDLIDEDALADALNNNRIRGAALDVFATEPLPSTSPFWSMENVLVTPHVSATSTRYWRRETHLIVENIERYLAGRPLRNAVDKTAGY